MPSALTGSASGGGHIGVPPVGGKCKNEVSPSANHASRALAPCATESSGKLWPPRLAISGRAVHAVPSQCSAYGPFDVPARPTAQISAAPVPSTLINSAPVIAAGL